MLAPFGTKRLKTHKNGWPKRRSNQLECGRTAKSEKRFSQSYLTFNHLHGMYLSLEWHANGIS